MKNKGLKKRIIEISYKHKLSHLGSCLTAVDIIKEIFDQKKPDEKFVLSSGHAGVALYVVLEQKGGRNAEEIFLHHGVHPDRCSDCGIDCSTGSLGQGLPIAVGMALADRKKDVYCLISDGECAEGSIWEALTIKDKYEISNLRIYCNVNGWGAYDPIDKSKLLSKLMFFDRDIKIIDTDSNVFGFLRDQESHYYTMNEKDYEQAISLLS